MGRVISFHCSIEARRDFAHAADDSVLLFVKSHWQTVLSSSTRQGRPTSASRTAALAFGFGNNRIEVPIPGRGRARRLDTPCARIAASPQPHDVIVNTRVRGAAVPLRMLELGCRNLAGLAITLVRR
jgi:hypothetical protein